MTAWIRWFDDLGMDDVPVVGGKNASLGEMRRALTPLGIRTPDGFATTADAYRAFLRAASLERVIADALGRVDITDIERCRLPARASGPPFWRPPCQTRSSRT